MGDSQRDSQGDSQGLLSREAILAADDRPTRDVPVPEWGGTVRVRTLGGAERDAWEGAIAARMDPKTGHLDARNLRATLVALTAVDAQGERIFPTPEDVELLGKKSGAALDRVFAAAKALNAIGPQEEAELLGNSARAPSDSSPSPSPASSA